MHYAKSSAGWSTFISGLQLNYDQFNAEELRACEQVRGMQAVKA